MYDAPMFNRSSALRRQARPLLLLLSVGLSACVDADIRVGRRALGQGDYPLAIEAFDRAQARQLSGELWREPLAGAHRAQAMQQLEAQDCAAATAHFEAAEALSAPLLSDAQALYRCRVAREDLPEGHVPTLERLFALGDRRVELLRDLYTVYGAQQRTADQLRMAQELEQRSFLSDEDRRHIWPLFEAQDEHAEARRHLEILALREPLDPIVVLQLVTLRERLDDPQGALELMRRLTFQFEDNPAVFLRYAQLLERQGHTDRAHAARARAHQLRPVLQSPDERVMRPLPKSKR